MSSFKGSRSGPMWAITSYFNPVGYRRRLANFRLFREGLRVPLIAVELTYASEFELGPQDADILIQLRGGAVLWQKERLLNVALRALPPECRKVAWLDCDLLFARPDWAEVASARLDEFATVQLFSNVHYLGPDWIPGSDLGSHVEFTRPSCAFSVGSGVPASSCVVHLLDVREGTCAPGFAWAARREILDRHGFYDGCIVGGGDRAMISAAHGCFDELMQRHYMNGHERERYMNWARAYHRAVRGETGFLEGDIHHLWHGDIRARKPRSRHEGLRSFEFDPFRDVAANDNGPWRWNTDKPAMHEFVRAYFVSRREDG